MSSTTMTVKGQVTIPAELRRKFGLKPGQKVIIEDDGDAMRLRPAVTDVSAAFGLVKSKRTVSLDDMDRAIAEGAQR